MHSNSLFTAVMIGLLISPAQALAESGARWLNDGKPVKARVFEPAIDLNMIPLFFSAPNWSDQRSGMSRASPRLPPRAFRSPFEEGFQTPTRG
jgi:hypothetical protein